MSHKSVLLAAAGIGLFGAIVFISTPTMVWSGGFGDVEYQIRFVGADGTPVPGVQLRIENEQGTNFFHYPVTDYVSGQVLASDDHGVLRFHHVSNGPEFGGRCWNLFGVCFGTCKSPAFVCRYLLDGKEVHRSKFNDMNATATEPRVTRTWNYVQWLPSRREGESYMDRFASESDQRDKDRDGTVDMAESAALNSIASLTETAYSVERGSVPPTKELEFSTFQETVVVK